MKINKVSLLTSLLLGFSASMTQANEQIYSPDPPVTPTYAKQGAWLSGVKTIKAVNPDQLDVKGFQFSYDRPLTFEVWYPTQDSDAVPAVYANQTRLGKSFNIKGASLRDAKPSAKQKYPLVVLSHGYTGYRTIMYYLGEHLASRGYVVVSIDHTDSTNEDVDFKKDPHSGFVSTLYNRARDQQFALDFIAEPKNGWSDLVDVEQSAVVGFSMGGYGAINTVGGCFDINSDKLKNIGFPTPLALLVSPFLSSCYGGRDKADERWKAMVAFAPWGQQFDLHNKEKLAQLNLPSLFVAGSEDDVSGYENGVKKLYEQTRGQDKYLLVYENARHNIAPHPAPEVAYQEEADYGHYADPVWSSEKLNSVNKHMVTAFLDCHVKKVSEACETLPKRLEATQQTLPHGGKEKPWPGFADRYGVGMKFYRR